MCWECGVLLCWCRHRLIHHAASCHQVEIEWYFRDTASLTATDTYWVGLYKSPLYYYFADGTNVGNGVVSNGDPYAHW